MKGSTCSAKVSVELTPRRDNLNILRFNKRGSVCGFVVVSPQLLQILSQRGLPVFVQSAECSLCRSIIRAKELNYVCGRKLEIERAHPRSKFQIRDAVTQSFAHRLLVAPLNRRRHVRWRRYVLANDLE